MESSKNWIYGVIDYGEQIGARIIKIGRAVMELYCFEVAETGFAIVALWNVVQSF